MHQIRPNSYIRSTDTGDGVLLLDLYRGKYFSLSATASLIWMALEQRTPVNEIVRLLTSSFTVSEEQASRDVDRLIQTLHDKGLVDHA